MFLWLEVVEILESGGLCYSLSKVNFYPLFLEILYLCVNPFSAARAQIACIFGCLMFSDGPVIQCSF